MPFRTVYKIRDIVPYETESEFQKARKRPTWALNNYKKYAGFSAQFLDEIESRPIPDNLKLKTARDLATKLSNLKNPYMDYEFSIVRTDTSQTNSQIDNDVGNREGGGRGKTRKVEERLTGRGNGRSEPVQIGRSQLRNTIFDPNQSYEDIDFSHDSGIQTSPTNVNYQNPGQYESLNTDQISEPMSQSEPMSHSEPMSQSQNSQNSFEFPSPPTISRRTRSQTGSAAPRQHVIDFSSDSDDEPEINSDEEEAWEEVQEEWTTTEDLKELAKSKGRYSAKYIRFLLRMHERGVSIRSIQSVLRYLKKEFKSLNHIDVASTFFIQRAKLCFETLLITQIRRFIMKAKYITVGLDESSIRLRSKFAIIFTNELRETVCPYHHNIINTKSTTVADAVKRTIDLFDDEDFNLTKKITGVVTDCAASQLKANSLVIDWIVDRKKKNGLINNDGTVSRPLQYRCVMHLTANSEKYISDKCGINSKTLDIMRTLSLVLTHYRNLHYRENNKSRVRLIITYDFNQILRSIKIGAKLTNNCTWN